MGALAAKVEIEDQDWKFLISELARRSNGIRESGAFLLSDTKVVKAILFYDDLDPGCLHSEAIHFKAAGYVKLWAYCLEHSLQVIADIHTHPSEWTNQSLIDKEFPMISEPGHVALIVPFYGQVNQQGLKGFGVFEYQGNYKWKTLSGNKIKVLHNGRG